MKPKSIGIIGGAGPLAGACLLERLLLLSGSKYGCYRDADFPKILLISYPFSDMLSSELKEDKVKQELSLCLNQLRAFGAEILAIACNTLHVFLEDSEKKSDLLQLPSVVSDAISLERIPLVLCTSTSSKSRLHEKFFPCVYPADNVQVKIDDIIDQILKGEDREMILVDLVTLIQSQTASSILLGCTELSLFTKDLAFLNKTILDPLDIVAVKILERSFSEGEAA